ncbi:MAG: hypothetical protein MZV70_64320 [Desulfobacterales bacterium]|nr:hypothetical protein [Desulfobacterales bacterium]
MALIDHPQADRRGADARIIPGPDFPTGGIIYGRGGIREAYRDRPRHHPGAGPGDRSRRTSATRPKPWSSPSCPTRSTRPSWSRRSPSWSGTSRSTASSYVRDESDREGMRIALGLKKDGHGPR